MKIHVPGKAWVTQWLRKWSEMEGGQRKILDWDLRKRTKMSRKINEIKYGWWKQRFSHSEHLLSKAWVTQWLRRWWRTWFFLRKNHPDRWKTLNWTRSEQGLGHAMAPEVVGKGGFSSLRTARSKCLMKMNDVWTPSIYRQWWKH